jgi:hypothetical protein
MRSEIVFRNTLILAKTSGGKSGCVLLIWPELVGTPGDTLPDLQLNEFYYLVMSPAKIGFTEISRWYAEVLA